jgi:hypothetical protein
MSGGTSLGGPAGHAIVWVGDSYPAMSTVATSSSAVISWFPPCLGERHGALASADAANAAGIALSGV